MAKKASGVTISQRPNGSWRVQIRKKGFPQQSHDFRELAEADEWGIAQLATIQESGRLADFRAARETTLGTIMERYIAEVTRKRPSQESREAEEYRLRRFMRAEKFLCDHAVAYITPEQLREWRDRRLTELPSRGRAALHEETVPEGRFRRDGTPRKNAAAPKERKPLAPVKPGTVRREMSMLKKVFDFAMREVDLKSNPINVVDKIPANDERSVRIEQGQFDQLLEACRQRSNPWVAPVVELAWEIGARRGSILKLEWSDVDLGNACVTMRGVKNSRHPSEVRTVEVGLTPRAVEILKGLPRSLDGRVFPITAGAFASAWKRAREQAGLDFFRFHDTRHEMASRLAENDWDLIAIMQQGDWRDVKSVKRYASMKGKTLGQKLARLRR